jgi:hypothetical protein
MRTRSKARKEPALKLRFSAPEEGLIVLEAEAAAPPLALPPAALPEAAADDLVVRAEEIALSTALETDATAEETADLTEETRDVSWE